MQYCVILHTVEPHSEKSFPRSPHACESFPQGLRFLPQSKTCKVNSPVTFPMMGALVCEWYLYSHMTTASENE